MPSRGSRVKPGGALVHSPLDTKPSRSPNQINWITSPSDDKIDSVASFTNTPRRLNSTDEVFGTYKGDV
jgi:hypothetical protein